MLNRSLLIEAGKGDFVTVVCVDRLECKSVKEEQLVRKNPIKVKVEPQDYVEFVEELVESGWHLSEGAKLNLEFQKTRKELIEKVAKKKFFISSN